MSRRTRRENEQIVEVFYGIDCKTFEVERVSLTRGGELSKMGPGGAYGRHLVMHGRLPRNEVIIVWGLTDIISFPVGMEEGDYAKRELAALRAKAAEMKAASEKKA